MVTMQVFIREARTMIAASVQRDVDGVSKVALRAPETTH